MTWNCNRLRNKTEELSLMLRKQNMLVQNIKDQNTYKMKTTNYYFITISTSG